MSSIPYHEHTFVIPTATTEEIAAGIVSDKAVTPDQLLPVLESLDFSEAMPKLIYDPNNVAGDVFDMDNMVEGATNLILTAAERALIASAVQTGDALVAADIGTTVQAWDAQLDSLSSASANGVSLVTAADYAAMRALLDLEAGTDFYSKAGADAAFQPLDSDLTSIAALSTASYGRSLLTLANAAALAAEVDPYFLTPSEGNAAYQPLDSDLTALAALAATAGMLARTGAGAFAVRTLTAPAAGITVSNGDGASGNPTLALANDLSALEALGSTGLAARTATDTWAQRTITGTANHISVTNGNGVSGNPTLDIGSSVALLDTEDQTIAGGGRVTVKDLGNLSGTTITPDPGDRPIQKITNNGAGTIAPGSNNGCYILIVKNTTGAGAITTSGWQDVSGEAFDTTTTSEFVCHCTITADLSAMVINKVA